MPDDKDNEELLYLPDGEITHRDNHYHLTTSHQVYELQGNNFSGDLEPMIELLNEGCLRSDIERFNEKLRGLIDKLEASGVVLSSSALSPTDDLDPLARLADVHADPVQMYLLATKTTLSTAGPGSDTLESTLRPYGFRNYTERVKESDLLVTTYPDLSAEFEDLAVTAAIESVPFVPIRSDRSLHVGPTIHPQRVCVDCYRRRRTSTVSRPESFELTRQMQLSDRRPMLLDEVGSILLGAIERAVGQDSGLPAQGVEYDPKEPSINVHYVDPVPGCSTCDTHSGPVSSEPDYETLVGNRTGIVTSVDQHNVDHIFPGYWLTRSTSSDFTILFDNPRQHSSGGAAVVECQADGRRRAIGEAIERYVLEVPPDEIREGSLESVSNPLWWEPYEDDQYADTDFPYDRLEPTDILAWIPLRRLGDNRSAHLPASLVYSGYQSLREVTSSGAACHTTLDRATLGGLLEVIERDAIVTIFLHDLPVPRLDWETVVQHASDRTAAISASGLEVVVLDITTDLDVPTYFALGIDDDRRFAVGAGCNPVASDAVEESLEELMLTYHQIREVYQPDPAESIDSPESIKTLNDHLFYYQGANGVELFDDKRRTTVTNLRPDLCSADDSTDRKLGVCFDRLQAADIDAYVHETTTNDVERAGLRTVKVFAPQLADINVEWSARHLGQQRLHEVPERMGYKSNITDQPHPMP